MTAARALRAALDDYLAGEGEARLLRVRDPRDVVVPRAREKGRWLAGSGGQDALQEAQESQELSERAAERLRRQVDWARHRALMREAERALSEAVRDLTGASGEAFHVREELARIAVASDAKHRGRAGVEVDHALRAVAEHWVGDCIQAEQPLLRTERDDDRGGAAPEPTVSPGGLLIVSSLEAALAQPDPQERPQALPGEPWLEAAREFLARTDDAAEDAVRFCTRELTRQYPAPWTAWLRGLRVPELDSQRGARERWRRVSAWLRALGFEPELGGQLRAEVEGEAFAPFARVVVCHAPRDLRVAQSPDDQGVASDLFAAGAAARALGVALALPTLPAELRWPLPGCSADAVGGLGAQLWADRGHLQRIQSMGGPEAERVARAAASLHLVSTRFACGVATAGLDDLADGRARCEALAEVAGRALGCDLPAALAGLLGGDRPGLRARARGGLLGLALHHVLRERYDEDWYRNPRAGEPLRAACNRGNGVSGEAFVEELGGSLDVAAARALELVA